MNAAPRATNAPPTPVPHSTMPIVILTLEAWCDPASPAAMIGRRHAALDLPVGTVKTRLFRATHFAAAVAAAVRRETSRQEQVVDWGFNVALGVGRASTARRRWHARL